MLWPPEQHQACGLRRSQIKQTVSHASIGDGLVKIACVFAMQIPHKVFTKVTPERAAWTTAKNKSGSVV
jgi:hypothetical protein